MQKTIALLLLLFSGAAFSQQVRVISKSDLQPISNCLIYNNDSSVSVTTNNDGIADLSKFKSTDKLHFRHLIIIPAEFEKSYFKSDITEVKLTTAVINLQEIVLSANRAEEKYTDIPVKIDIITLDQIRFGNPQTTADLLQQNGTVFLQQSQLGGGSPVLRGMEANRVLMVVDGVRMNNAIYRAGHLQNIITIDPNILKRVEVVHGPGSVIYGSEAMGGVMHFYTRSPIFSTNGKVYTSGNAMLRYSSAANSLAQSYTVNVGGKKIAAFLGASFKNLNDLREGSKRDSNYGDWGKCLNYADRIDGQDVMATNSNPLIQKNSGYSQYDLFGKVAFKPSTNYAVTLNTQFSNSSNVPRYDRLSEMSGGKLKYATWYYGPQTRGFVSLKNELSKATSIYDNAQVIAAYQYISEDRVSRGFGKSNTKHQEETVNVFSLNADFTKQIFTKSELRYGLEGVHNAVGSKAYNHNINTDEITYDAATRYPDSSAKMNNFAAYASNSWEISNKLIFLQGIRFNYISLNASYSQAMMDLLDFPFDATTQQDNTAVNGSLGLIYMPGNGWRFTTNLSTGFRAPNIDDLSKLNDSNSTDQIIIVPNPELQPENAYNAELTVGKTFGDFLQIDATGFYTLLSDVFVVKPTLYNGQDSIIFDESLSAVQSMQNVDQAVIWGFEGNLTAQITKVLSFRTNLTYTYGHVKTDDVPLDHIPPLFGYASLKLGLSKFTGEFNVRYNAWKHIEDYSPSGEDNEVYAAKEGNTIVGTPSWYTLNLLTAYQFNRYLGLQAGIENILDKHYRNFASGISAPGRNIYVTLRASF